MAWWLNAGATILPCQNMSQIETADTEMHILYDVPMFYTVSLFLFWADINKLLM
jgi:hypothetical protein